MTPTASSGPAPESIDVSACDREPIHIPGSIQPFGVLLVLDELSGTILQASANVGRWLEIEAEAAIGRRLETVIGASQWAQVRGAMEGHEGRGIPLYLGTIAPEPRDNGQVFSAVAHRDEGLVLLELESASTAEAVSFPRLYPLIRTFVADMERAATTVELSRLAAAEVRRITGFDRVLIYRFDDDGHGTVVAEDRNDALPSYLDHRFPASDIPSQARELYRKNRLRLIADAWYTPVPLVPERNPKTGRPLDMTFSSLRSVSPVHLEYMRNMKTAASLSISVLREGRLWGLISCHHATPLVVPFEIRTACEFLGQVLSLQLAAKERNQEFEDRIRLKSMQARLLVLMANEDHFVDGLIHHPDALLEFASAQGAAILFDGRCTRLGVTPEESDVMALAGWLADQGPPQVFHTDSLAAALPGAVAYKESASGLLAISISKFHRCLIFWFRPEVLQTINWGGDPTKPLEDSSMKLHPRRSFETWRETVRLRSLPWLPAEVDAAADLRHAAIGIVLRRAEELAELSAELKRANRELEAFSYSVSHDLRAPFRHIVGYSELLREEPGLSETGRRYIRTVIESAQYAGVLVDNLLAFSQMARTALSPVQVDMSRAVAEICKEVTSDASGRDIRCEVGDLPPARCDPIMIRLVLRNLLSNAVKYTRGREPAVIRVTGEDRPTETVYSVADNGVGFDMKYVDKLFCVFQRLHRMEDFEGTGIGLANVRRIVERHGGRAWADGVADHGATFSFSLPKAADWDQE